MIDEAFERELFTHLLESRNAHPEMQARDVVKFLMQGMMGNGHLLAFPKIVQDYLKNENDSLEADPERALIEPLSAYWMRLDLRRAKAEMLTEAQITNLMFLTDRILRDTHFMIQTVFRRQDVYEACGRFAQLAASRVPELGIEAANLALQIDKEKERILDPDWIPSHSALYQSLYHPAYRVISAAWAPFMEAICRISRSISENERTFVTLDGPCATGKTTLAQLLAEVFDAQVIHTDDYVVPHAGKTKQRLSIPGGNCDWERLTGELLLPWKEGKEGIYRRYQCRLDRRSEPEAFPKKKVLILEGSYCNLPAIRELADVRLFLDASWEERLRRLRSRESQAYLQGFFDRWIPLENAYLEAYQLPDKGMLTILSQAAPGPQ